MGEGGCAHRKGASKNGNEISAGVINVLEGDAVRKKAPLSSRSKEKVQRPQQADAFLKDSCSHEESIFDAGGWTKKRLSNTQRLEEEEGKKDVDHQLKWSRLKGKLSLLLRGNLIFATCEIPLFPSLICFPPWRKVLLPLRGGKDRLSAAEREKRKLPRRKTVQKSFFLLPSGQQKRAKNRASLDESHHFSKGAFFGEAKGR